MVGKGRRRGAGTQDLKKKTFFLIEKYIEDARQDEKHVPDLLESIMRPTDPVKEELRQKLFKMTQFDPKIKKIRVSDVRKNPGFDQRSLRGPILTPFSQYLAPLGAKCMEKWLKQFGF